MLFVSKPLHILLVAALLAALYALVRFSAAAKTKSARPLLSAAVAWLLYAAWEWSVMMQSPGADIRIDLLIIWPILGLTMVWALFRLFR